MDVWNKESDKSDSFHIPFTFVSSAGEAKKEKANKRQLQAAVECIILALKTPKDFSLNYSGVIWSIDAWQNSPGWVPVLLSRKIGGWSVEFCKQKQQGGDCAAVSEHGQCIGSKKELL